MVTWTQTNPAPGTRGEDRWARFGTYGQSGPPPTPPTTEPTDTPKPTKTYTPTPTPTYTNTPTNTNTPTPTPTPTPTACPSTPTPVPSSTCTAPNFQDVQPSSPFYPFVRCLACRGVLGGYPCGGPGEPCACSTDPYFRPNANITRGQVSKVVSQAAALADAPGGQIYQDVPPASPFYEWINRLTNRAVMSGYPCGGVGEPCQAGNKPYFRPNFSTTRGQLSKIASNAAGFNEQHTDQIFEDVPPSSDPSSFYIWIERLGSRGIIDGYSGYACGGSGSRPCFLPYNSVTRGQASKIVANTFFPQCNPSGLTNRPGNEALPAPPPQAVPSVQPTLAPLRASPFYPRNTDTPPINGGYSMDYNTLPASGDSCFNLTPLGATQSWYSPNFDSASFVSGDYTFHVRVYTCAGSTTPDRVTYRLEYTDPDGGYAEQIGSNVQHSYNVPRYYQSCWTSDDTVTFATSYGRLDLTNKRLKLLAIPAVGNPSIEIGSGTYLSMPSYSWPSGPPTPPPSTPAPSTRPCEVMPFGAASASASPTSKTAPKATSTPKGDGKP